MNMLEIHSLTVAYQAQPVLHNVSFNVQAGEIVALVGPNGAGKTSLIRATSGVIQPQDGAIFVAGKDITHLASEKRARYLAVVPQVRRLPPAFTVWQTVLLGRTPYLGWLGQAGQTDLKRTQWALDRTNTSLLADRRVDELSGGEQQRVLLARSICQQTPILLLDEPTAHLDLQYQTSLLNLVRELATEQKLAILMAVHDLNLASLYADRVALLVKGRLCALGVPEEIFTSERLMEVYQVPLQVIPHPEYGTPLIIPDGRVT